MSLKWEGEGGQGAHEERKGGGGRVIRDIQA